jgi:hypothetical protein
MGRAFWEVLEASHSFRSAPAQKAREVPPVRMVQWRVGSASYHWKRAARSACPVELMQFRSAGRLRVIRRIEGWGKERRESLGTGGGVVKGGEDILVKERTGIGMWWRV